MGHCKDQSTGRRSMPVTVLWTFRSAHAESSWILAGYGFLSPAASRSQQGFCDDGNDLFRQHVGGCFFDRGAITSHWREAAPGDRCYERPDLPCAERTLAGAPAGGV